MNVIVMLIIAGGCVAGGFLLAFVWAVRSGQFDDTMTPAVRVLVEEREVRNGQRSSQRTAKLLTNSEAPDEQRSS